MTATVLHVLFVSGLVLSTALLGYIIIRDELRGR